MRGPPPVGCVTTSTVHTAAGASSVAEQVSLDDPEVTRVLAAERDGRHSCCVPDVLHGDDGRPCRGDADRNDAEVEGIGRRLQGSEPLVRVVSGGGDLSAGSSARWAAWSRIQHRSRCRPAHAAHPKS